MMLCRNLIALAALDAETVPVEIVQLQLDILNLGVRGQKLIQQLGTVVVGKADVTDQTLCLLFLNEVPAVQPVKGGVTAPERAIRGRLLS